MAELARMIITINTLGGVYKSINWANERRRRWVCRTIQAGWEFEVEVIHETRESILTDIGEFPQ